MADKEFDIIRYDAAERTEYRIGSRVFTMRDLSIDTYDDMVVLVQQLAERAATECASDKDGTWLDFARWLLGACADDLAGAWNRVLSLPEGETVDGAWMRKTMTVPRLKRIFYQVVKDNGWEALEQAVEEKLFPFVLDLAKRRLCLIAATVQVPGA